MRLSPSVQLFYLMQFISANSLLYQAWLFFLSSKLLFTQKKRSPLDQLKKTGEESDRVSSALEL
jgi:hypothetical protein